ncbi:ATP-binding cassette domain-containing protein [Lysobacter korlensis]|uniref:ATP-binding cassette domain-containing protein n=1 Tax=Lysobacter korlensis TaxID=553636 RepID=A0ABV6RI80_9GAMM
MTTLAARLRVTGLQRLDMAWRPLFTVELIVEYGALIRRPRRCDSARRDSVPGRRESMTDTRLEIQSLGFGLLSGISLTLHPGGCVGLMGPSGCGKSRLLRAIADLDPNEGDVRLNGRDRMRFTPSQWRRCVALLPSESHWWAERVGEHFVASSEDLQALDLPPEAIDFAVSRLSSGERQRLAILRTFAVDPPVALLDEPTANLDDANTRRVEQWVARQRRDRGISMLWVSHDEAQLERVASRALSIRNGVLVPLWTR